MLIVLELHICNNTSCKTQSQTWFIGLIQEVPNINTISFCDENYSRTRWRECTTSIMSLIHTSKWSKDWLVIILKINFPNCEMEIVYCEQKIWEELWSLKSQARSVFFFTFIHVFDIFCDFWTIILISYRSHTPVNLAQITFIRGTPKNWSSLSLRE